MYGLSRCLLCRKDVSRKYERLLRLTSAIIDLFGPPGCPRWVLRFGVTVPAGTSLISRPTSVRCNDARLASCSCESPSRRRTRRRFSPKRSATMRESPLDMDPGLARSHHYRASSFSIRAIPSRWIEMSAVLLKSIRPPPLHVRGPGRLMLLLGVQQSEALRISGVARGRMRPSVGNIGVGLVPVAEAVDGDAEASQPPAQKAGDPGHVGRTEDPGLLADPRLRLTDRPERRRTALVDLIGGESPADPPLADVSGDSGSEGSSSREVSSLVLPSSRSGASSVGAGRRAARPPGPGRGSEAVGLALHAPTGGTREAVSEVFGDHAHARMVGVSCRPLERREHRQVGYGPIGLGLRHRPGRPFYLPRSDQGRHGSASR